MRISDWSSDVCSSDLKWIQYITSPEGQVKSANMAAYPCLIPSKKGWELLAKKTPEEAKRQRMLLNEPNVMDDIRSGRITYRQLPVQQSLEDWNRSEEHTSELQSLMRISYAVFCLTKKKHTKTKT